MKVKELLNMLAALKPDDDVYINLNTNPFDGVSSYLSEPKLAHLTEEERDDLMTFEKEAKPPVGTIYLR